jgi:hypothetical protein
VQAVTKERSDHRNPKTGHIIIHVILPFFYLAHQTAFYQTYRAMARLNRLCFSAARRNRPTPPTLSTESAAKLLSKDEARRIAANIAKQRELMRSLMRASRTVR